MAFDKSKDVTHCECSIVGEKNTLVVAVKSYNGGERKLQIGPRTYTKVNGSTGYGKAGRITCEEYAQLKAMLPQIEEALLG